MLSSILRVSEVQCLLQARRSAEVCCDVIPLFLDGRILHFMLYFHAPSSCKLMILLPLQEACACCGALCRCNRSSSWIKHNDLVVCFHVVCRQLHCFRRHDVLGASMIPVGCLRATNAMKDHCNTICVLKSAPLLVTSKL